MAAACPSISAEAFPGKVVIKAEPESDDEACVCPEDVPKHREPVVPLLSPVCGLRPLVWSEDHRLAVSTSSALCVVEMLCDVHSSKQELTLHRTSITVPSEEHHLRVGPQKEHDVANKFFSSHPDPTIKQVYVANAVVNPQLPPLKGIKYASWSPLGCDTSGRCLLACLTLDHRLTVHHSHKRLEWKLLVDLSKKYGEKLKERGYAKKDNIPPHTDLLDFDELQRRFHMQTPICMEWSSIYTIKQVLPDNTGVDREMILLAVLMENGDIVLWKIILPFTSGTDIDFYVIIESGVDRPSDLAWWEYQCGDRRMSGLIVGSEDGPVKIMPVNLTGLKGYFTLRLPVVLWKECDGIAVKNIKCVPMIHPVHKTSCSLIVASRGCYVFWCLLMISNAGLNVHNSHVAGLHSLPIVSLVVSHHGVIIYTCSTDGWIKKLTPSFSEKSLYFKVEDMPQPETLTRRRIHGIAATHNGGYMAIASTQGIVNNNHPIERTYQIHFMALKTPEAAGGMLLKSPSQNLFKMADLLDIIRWQILKNQDIPVALQQELDRTIQEENLGYFWRFKLFLLLTLQKALLKPKVDVRWKPTPEVSKVFITDNGEEQDAEQGKGRAPLEEENREVNVKEEENSEQMAEVQAWINSVETHIMRENIKKVLGAVYLNTSITQSTSIPTCGLVDFLSGDALDRDAEYLLSRS